MNPHISLEQARQLKIGAQADVIVVGGGPAGISAAVSAARSGASVVLLERYAYLGGLAAGGMVLVLDDLTAPDGTITVHGSCMEFIERMHRMEKCVFPPEVDRRSSPETWQRWARWGVHDFRSKMKPQPIVFAAAFDPEGWKKVSNDLVKETGIQLRLHNWFSAAIVEDGAIRGVVCETKEGRQAVLGQVVIDTTGDLDVAASAGAKFNDGSFIVTTVFRLGGVDFDAAADFEFNHPEEYHKLDRTIRQLIGGCWDHWWLKTPLPGVAWCNCPHMTGFDAMKVADQTRADFEGRERIYALIDFLHREQVPGFEKCYLIDVAPQLGVRQTRLLHGEYVVTKQDIAECRWFEDSVARGRDYYTPYRSMLPQGVDNLIVAGRHYSATSTAQKMSREIGPCMTMGDAAGVAAALAVDRNVAARHVDIKKIQQKVRALGGDPGDQAPTGQTTQQPEMAYEV